MLGGTGYPFPIKMMYQGVTIAAKLWEMELKLRKLIKQKKCENILPCFWCFLRMSTFQYPWYHGKGNKLKEKRELREIEREESGKDIHIIFSHNSDIFLPIFFTGQGMLLVSFL